MTAIKGAGKTIPAFPLACRSAGVCGRRIVALLQGVPSPIFISLGLRLLDSLSGARIGYVPLRTALGAGEAKVPNRQGLWGTLPVPVGITKS